MPFIADFSRASPALEVLSVSTISMRLCILLPTSHTLQALSLRCHIDPSCWSSLVSTLESCTELRSLRWDVDFVHETHGTITDQCAPVDLTRLINLRFVPSPLMLKIPFRTPELRCCELILQAIEQDEMIQSQLVCPKLEYFQLAAEDEIWTLEDEEEVKCLRLVSKLPSLRELVLDWIPWGRGDALIEDVAFHPSLQKITFGLTEAEGNEDIDRIHSMIDKRAKAEALNRALPRL